MRRRATARRITLRVSSATGEIVLTLPERTALAAAQAFADSHGAWIAARVAKLPERVAFVPGAMVPCAAFPTASCTGRRRPVPPSPRPSRTARR